MKGKPVMALKSIFILGMHRSGTTFTNFILGAHPDCIAVGEVWEVIRPRADRNWHEGRYASCTCGSCEFWPRVMEEIRRQGAESAVERYSSFAEVFARSFPGKIPVDSSKIPAAMAAASQAMDVVSTIVFRDVRGWCYSSAGGVKPRPMLGWYRRNLRLERDHPEAVPVSYEMLVLDAERAIPSLYSRLGLAPHPIPERLERDSAHILIGNRMRGRKDENILYDYRWMADQSIWPAVLRPVMRYNNSRVYSLQS